MSSVERLTVGSRGAVYASESGEYVRYSDHAAALAAERAKFADEIDRLREKNRELNHREQAATRATADAKRCFDELQKNLGGATPWVGGSLGPALLGWQLRERTEEVQTLRDRLAKFAAFAGPDGEPRSHCLNCGTWWDRVGKCPLCMNTHAETTSALAAFEKQHGIGGGA